MKKILLLILVLFSISLVSAQGERVVCIDNDAPSAPSNLQIVKSADTITLSWSASSDEPDCSGIDHYNIYRGTVDNYTKIGESTTTSYTDTYVAGETYYRVTAVDKGDNEGSAAEKSIPTETSSGNGGRSTGGGGGGGAIPTGASTACTEDWTCTDWSECLDGTQTRTCTDNNNCGTEDNKPAETRDCVQTQPAESVPTVTEGGSNLGIAAGTSTGLTGAVVATLSDPGNATVIAVIIILGLVLFWFLYKKRKKKNK